MNRNEIINNLKIISEEEVSAYQDKFSDDVNYMAALNVEGGGAFKKGVKIGLQENLVGGIIIYDGENFIGFSEKYGICLLSNHHNNINLQLPESIFIEKKQVQTERKIKPVQQNDFDFDSSKNKNELTKPLENELVQNLEKKLNMDIEVKDLGYFYTTIPKIYENTKFELIFDIKILYDEQAFLSEIYIVFINPTDKKIKIEFNQKNLYFTENFRKIIYEKEICEIKVRRINKFYILVNQIFYKHN